MVEGMICAYSSMAEGAMLGMMTPEQREAYCRERTLARIKDKETNMKNRLERRRHAIYWKWTSRALCATAALIAIPLMIRLI